MRKTKFRVWESSDLETYKMVYQNDDSMLEFFDKVDDENLMEFTGLNDRNGKEIYEFDMVMTADGDIGKVYYDCACFLTSLQSVEGDCSLYMWDPSECLEVIGNIFENPELLTCT